MLGLESIICLMLILLLFLIAIGKYSEDWLNDALCFGNVETDYLIYQNFFYYSEATGKFYTSIVETGNFYYLGNYTEVEKG